MAIRRSTLRRRLAMGLILALLAIGAPLAAAVPASAAGTAVIRGTLIDDNGPLSGRSVSLFGPGGIRNATTTPTGAFEFAGLSAGGYTLNVFLFALPGEAPWVPLTDEQRSVTLTSDTAVVTRELRVHRVPTGSGSIHGVVTDARDGAVIPGARVTVRAEAGWQAGSATTDAAGSWTVGSLPDGVYGVSLSPPSGRTDFEWSSTPPPTSTVVGGGRAERTDTLVSVGPAIGTFGGVVRDAASHLPLPGLSLHFERLRGGHSAAATTDARGAYLTPAMPAGDYYLVTGDPQWYFEGTGAILTVTAGAQRVDLPLTSHQWPAATGVLDVTVQNPAGQPVQGARVTAKPVDSSDERWVTESTNGAGLAHLVDVPLRAVTIEVEYDDPSGARFTGRGLATLDASHPTATRAIRLVAESAISGRIERSATPGNVFVTAWDVDTGAAHQIQSVGADGSYELSYLPAGRYVVAVSGPSETALPRGDNPALRFWQSAGGATGTPDRAAATVITLAVGQTRTGIDLTTVPAAEVTATVRMLAGGVAADLPRGTRIGIEVSRGATGFTAEPAYDGWTLEDGSLVIRGLAAGQYRLRLTDLTGGARALSTMTTAPVAVTAGGTADLGTLTLSAPQPTGAATPLDIGALPEATAAALRDQIVVGAGATAGQSIGITVGAEFAGEWVSVWANSTPVQLGGWTQVSADGTVTATLPTTLRGTHRIAVQDAAQQPIGWSQVVIAATDGEPESATVPVYRFWSPVFAGHFYTADPVEKAFVQANYPTVWSYERVAYQAFDHQVAGTVPLYRFWSATYRGHFFTADPVEKDFVIANYPTVWSFEGTAYWVYPEEYAGADLTSTVYRFWSASYAHHFFTASTTERDFVQANYPTIWGYEGDRFQVPVR